MPEPLRDATSIPSSAPAASPPPAPRGVQWIDVATAAGRMKLGERQIRNLCGGKWFAAGLARLDHVNGSQAWMIREDADAGLSRVQFADQLDYDSKELSGKQRDALNERMLILQQWRQRVAEGFRRGDSKEKATAEYLAFVQYTSGQRISKTTLYDWESRFKSGGTSALVDGRWRPACKADRKSDPFFEQLAHFWLDLRQPKLSVCHEMTVRLATERGWPLHSYPACARYVKGISPAIVILKRKGEEAYTNDAEPFIERDYHPVDSNEIWCGDHHEFDVWVNVGGAKPVRPWLTAWQDMRSRKIVGYVIITGDPNQQSILEAFRRGVMECGVPQKLYIDNGKDYDSYALNGQTKKQRRQRRRVGEFDPVKVQGVFARLGAGVIHCEPYHGQSKPIERFFGTLENSFGRTFETYCGNCPANRPENLADKLARGKAPTLAEFIASFEGWLAHNYHGQPHAGNGVDSLTPDAAFAANLRRKVTATREVLDALLLPRTAAVKVTQNGVLYKGIRYGQYAPELIPWLGKNVILAIDGQNLSHVQVWTEDDRFICVAMSNRRIPANATEAQLSQAKSEKGRHRKLQREFHDAKMRMHVDVTDLLIDAALTQNAARPPEPPADPPSIVPLRTAIEDQMPALQRSMAAAMPLRKAAGAEGMSVMSFANLAAALEDKRKAEDEAPYVGTGLREIYGLAGKTETRRESGR